MNWRYIKSFLILLVVLVDVLLLRFCYTYYTARDYTAQDTAEDAAAILGESGITVSPDLLAVRADSAPARSCTYTREDYARLVLSLLTDAETSGIFLLPDGIRAVTAAGDVALLGSDLSIDFTAAGRDAAAVEAAYAKGYDATADTAAVRGASLSFFTTALYSFLGSMPTVRRMRRAMLLPSRSSPISRCSVPM